MKKRKFFLLIVSLILIFLSSFEIVKSAGKGFCPFLEGGLVPCGRETDDPRTPICECYPCELCHLLVLFKRIVDFLTLHIIFPLAVLMIAIGGMMFIFALVGGTEVLPGGAKGGPALLSQGRKLITSVVIGLIIIFAAWLIVDTIIVFLTPANSPLQAWYEIVCPFCGDRICDPRENPITCPVDCLAFIWVPLSGVDQVAQIALTETPLPEGKVAKPGDIIKTYPTGDNPSRLTVIPGGDVWIGNRGDGTVTRLTPNFDNLPYYKFIDNYSVGGSPRAVTYDLNGDIWVGSCYASDAKDKIVKKLDPETGKVIAEVDIGKGNCAYGAIGDPYGRVWIANRRGKTAIKIDIRTNSVTHIPLGPEVYGIGMDNEGDIWVAAWHNDKTLMWQIDHLTDVVTSYPPKHTYYGGGRGRGIAVDGENNVWVVVDAVTAAQPKWENAPSYVYKFDNNGNYLTHTEVGIGAVGVAVDQRGNIWVVNYGGGGPNCVGDCTGGSVTKLNSKGEVIATYGFGKIDSKTNPYNYSDMTGFRALGCPKPR